MKDLDIEYLDYIDLNVIKALQRHGKKLKTYQIVNICKKELPYSELDILNSLEKLIKKEFVLLVDSNEFILNV